MADFQSARRSFLDIVEEIDPTVECVIPEKPVQGVFQIALSRSGETQVVKVSEKDFLTFDGDDKIRQKIEENVLAAIEYLPDEFEGGEDSEEDDEAIDEEDLEDGDFEEEEEGDEGLEEEEEEPEEEV